ncbi:MAG TPA: 2OG-Fe(II) oxygenase [Sphingomicrobium sp.]|nr:2OG-Fe(II) oxygenase [Sphingomicrobium sp.]
MARIAFYEDVLDERLCTFLLNNARERLKEGTEFSRSNFHWKPAIRKSSAVVLVRDYEPHLAQLILANLAERKIVEHGDYHVMNYAWTQLSYIPWHDDDQRSEALTIYLNDRWEADWGGLFLYRDDERQIRGFAPKFNCGLRNDNNVLHATTPVTLDAPEPRFTLQLFSK